MADSTTKNTSQTVQHRLPTEGADQLILAGVNDANLQELARICGCRVVLREDNLVLSGTLSEVERCAPIAQRMIDLAMMEKPFAPSDIQRFADDAMFAIIPYTLPSTDHSSRETPIARSPHSTMAAHRRLRNPSYTAVRCMKPKENRALSGTKQRIRSPRCARPDETSSSSMM